MKKVTLQIFWILSSLVAVYCLSQVAFHRGETINALWLVTATILVMLIGYRFYSGFIATSVLRLNPQAITPAVKHQDGLDFVPTPRFVVFGHHFAAIAGAGPLVGPVLAAQMGYLPGFLWLLVGCVLAGAVQDFMILIISMRDDARSLGELIRSELGFITGSIALLATFFILVILLGVLALVVVKALMDSPWSFFTVLATIPIAILMGIYMRHIRPGHVGEASIIGGLLLLIAIICGHFVAQSAMGQSFFSYQGRALAIMLMLYGFIASSLPIWFLLAPRDYLSTFLKIGTILFLAIGLFIVAPHVKMPAMTGFINGTGPVWSGNLFPFLFITIACGAVSGFHSLIASGTTPKLVANETDARFIGYGAMLMEGFVAMMALIVACCLEPGVYFALNSPAALIGNNVEEAATAITQWGFPISADFLTQTANQIGETTILSRIGGAPTLAIGMANIFSKVFANPFMMGFWYHFAILFEALFILTAVDAGTRAGRFILQDLFGIAFPSFKRTTSWPANLLATSLCVGAWGYFLYQGVVDPMGGINSLWPLFGIANQMLAAIALLLASVYLARIKRIKYLWVPLLPTIWLLVCTLSAGYEKVFSANAKIGFLSQARLYRNVLNDPSLSVNLHETRSIIFSNYVNATVAFCFSAIIIYISIQSCFKIFQHLKAVTTR